VDFGQEEITAARQRRGVVSRCQREVKRLQTCSAGSRASNRPGALASRGRATRRRVWHCRLSTANTDKERYRQEVEAAFGRLAEQADDMVARRRAA
jgi:hypothetical protein